MTSATAKSRVLPDAVEIQCVYFVQIVDKPLVKIGYTTSPLMRMQQLQTACPYPLVLLAALPGDKQYEAELHRQWAGLRRLGEWFTLTETARAHILAHRRQFPELWRAIIKSGRGALPHFGRQAVRETDAKLTRDIAAVRSGRKPRQMELERNLLGDEGGKLPGDLRAAANAIASIIDDQKSGVRSDVNLADITVMIDGLIECALMEASHQ